MGRTREIRRGMRTGSACILRRKKVSDSSTIFFCKADINGTFREKEYSKLLVLSKEASLVPTELLRALMPCSGRQLDLARANTLIFHTLQRR